MTHDIEAEITFVTTEAGGRKTPAFSGYRPQFYCDGYDYDAEQTYPDVAQVNPGDTVRAFLRFAAPDLLENKIVEGKVFLIREGSRTVAFGKVTQILKLVQSAQKQRDLEAAKPLRP